MVHFIKYVEANEKHLLTSSTAQLHPYLGWAVSLDFQVYFTVNFLGNVFFFYAVIIVKKQSVVVFMHV